MILPPDPARLQAIRERAQSWFLVSVAEQSAKEDIPYLLDTLVIVEGQRDQLKKENEELQARIGQAEKASAPQHAATDKPESLGSYMLGRD